MYLALCISAKVADPGAVNTDPDPTFNKTGSGSYPAVKKKPDRTLEKQPGSES